MTHWFFDPAATGTGSGDTPANAGTDIASFWSYMNSATTFGDKIWARRSTIASMGAVGQIFQMGRTDWSVNSHPYTWFIGWPRSHDAFYSERPQAGIDAGWDSDANTLDSGFGTSVIWDINSTSTNSVIANNGFGLANFNFLNAGMIANRGPRPNIFGKLLSPKYNIQLANYIFTVTTIFGRDITLVGSQGSVGTWLNSNFEIDKLTVSASSTLANACMGFGSIIFINELVLGTDVGHLFGLSAGTPAAQSPRNIGSLRGVKPTRTYYTGVSQRAMNRVEIGDYFGEGPASLSGRGRFDSYTPMSGSAVVNSSNALTMLFVSSGAGADVYNGTLLSEHSHKPYSHGRELISYNQGVPLVIRWPILIVGSANINPASVGVNAHVFVQGAGLGEAIMEVSSGFSWSGTSATSVGSAWVAKAILTPSSSGFGVADIQLPLHNPNNNDVVFVGRPEVNSA